MAGGTVMCGLLTLACPAGAQPAGTAPAPNPAANPAATARKSSPAPASRPAWKDLTPGQREALAPLAGMWETLEAEPKRKWLEVAANYPKLTPDAQQRVQQRMGEFARLSPEQRATARENFRSAYELPANERQEKLQRYQELPDDKKRALAEQAAKKQAQRATTVAPPASATPPSSSK